MMYLWIPVLFLLRALYTDWKQRKIYNTTTYPLALLGLSVQWYLNGGAVFGVLLGLVSMFVFLTTFYKAAIPGGGDVKLLIGCSLFLGLKGAGIFMLLVFALAALLGMIQYARLKGFGNLLKTLELDLKTAGTAPKEKVHILGALVILWAYVIAALIQVF